MVAAQGSPGPRTARFAALRPYELSFCYGPLYKALGAMLLLQLTRPLENSLHLIGRQATSTMQEIAKRTELYAKLFGHPGFFAPTCLSSENLPGCSAVHVFCHNCFGNVFHVLYCIVLSNASAVK